MNTLDRTLIEKAACEHGWENVIESHDEAVVVASARHRATARIVPRPAGLGWIVEVPQGLIRQELVRTLPQAITSQGAIVAADIDGLACILRRTAELAQSLPNQAALTYQAAVARELDKIQHNNTEVERLVKQRVGQDTFRQALMDYWGGACAVTGLDVPAVLRASHAKPWAICECDDERLNVFNGLLLTANLDALFDRGLITFDDSGLMIFRSQLTPSQRQDLHIDKVLTLRWLAPAHQHYLAWHRENIFGSTGHGADRK
jgi:hypothetical protein